MCCGSSPASLACGKAWEHWRSELWAAEPPGKILITHRAGVLPARPRMQLEDNLDPVLDQPAEEVQKYEFDKK